MNRGIVGSLVFGLLLCIPQALRAHDSRPVFIRIDEQAGGQLLLAWKVPDSVAASDAPRIDLSGNCRPDRHREPVDATGAANAPIAALQGLRWHACPEAAFPDSIRIGWPRDIPSLSTIIRVQWSDGAARTIHAGPGVTTIDLPQAATTRMVIGQYFVLGIEHILLGYDHLLFVACLVLLAGSFRRIALAVTGFTLAHSVTLISAALDLVRLPIPPVEAVIALSIVFLAAELGRHRRDTLTWRYPLVVAAIFGLLHGFGFASVLGEIGLPEGETLPALLSFNLGVEAGQLAFVAVLVPLVRVSARIKPTTTTQDWLTRSAAYPIGTLAMFWTIERLSALV